MQFDQSFEPRHGEAVAVAAGVTRVTAPNAGPFTFRGTNGYLVGADRVAVIDPGPDRDDHLDALLGAIGGRPVEAILLTHDHADHGGLAGRLRAATGAPVLAGRVAAPTRPDGATDDARADRVLADGESVAVGGARLTAVATPGHAPDHLCFALDGTGILFSGDHVMGWSTSVVLPPEGSILDYVASLDRLIARADRLLLPGHGGPIDDPVPWLRGLKAHRKMRGAAILARLKAGDRSVDELAATLYRGLGAERAEAARGMIAAHLAALAARGLVRVTETAADGTPARVAPAP